MNRLGFCRRTVLLALLSTLPMVVIAEEVTDLYEGQVTVSSDQEAERLPAQGRALRQVLGKLSGIAEPGGAVVEAAVAAPQRYLQQFSYRQSGDPAAPLTLWASFEAAAVDALLRDAQLPVWGAQRPGVLVWIALADAEGIDLLAADGSANSAAVMQALNQRARERGIPVVYPLLDLEDRVLITPAKVWQLDEAAIVAASARYGAGAILVGRLEADGTGAWSARWAMVDAANVSQWSTRGLSASATVPQAVDEVTQRLAARYAVLGGSGGQGGENGITVRVSGVRSVNDYSRTLNWFNGLDQVSELVLSAANNEELRLQMQVRGGAEGLRRVAAFSDVLASEPGAQGDDVVSFRLLP